MSLSPSNSTRQKQRKLRLSAEFRFWLVVGLVVIFYFIAGNIGSGWIFLLCAVMLALLALSVILPLKSLMGLQVKMRGPANATAGSRLEFSLDLLVEKLDWGVIKLQLPASSLYFGPTTNSDRNSFVVEVVNEKLTTLLPCPPLRRGVRPLPAVSVETSHPFGLIWACLEVQPEGSITIYPESVDVEGRFLLNLKSSMYVPGGSSAGLAGFHSSSFRGIRDYVRGDSRRFIHWTLSARHGSLMVKEFDREGLAAYDVAIDLGAGWNEEQFELALISAVSLLKFGHEQGIHPALYMLHKPVTDPTGVPEHIVTDEDQMDLLAAITLPQTSTPGSWEGFADRPRPTIIITGQEEPLDPPPSVVLMQVLNHPRNSSTAVWDPAARLIHIGSRQDLEEI